MDTTTQKPESAVFRRLAGEAEENLRRHVLAPWFPRALDKELGGFRQGFAEDWSPTGTGRERGIVYQSRLTWVASQVMIRHPELAGEYRGYVEHGIRSR
jgi:mannobiose 2-epimerase